MLSNTASASDEVKDRNSGFDFFTVYIEIHNEQILNIVICIIEY